MTKKEEIFFSVPLVRAALLFLVLSGMADEAVHAQTWQTFDKSKYLIIKYQKPEDLQQFDRQIKYSGGSKSGFSGFLFNSSRSSGSRENFEQRLADKLDSLFEKVQLILDMRKPIKVTVQLYPDEASLHEAYFLVYRKKGDLRAWYVFEYNTIFLNVQDMFEGMLAHECAHAIVDNFFDARPPRATAEILARYVDAHLDKEARTY